MVLQGHTLYNNFVLRVLNDVSLVLHDLMIKWVHMTNRTFILGYDIMIMILFGLMWHFKV